MLLALTMHDALWSVCLAVTATTTNAQIADMAEAHYPSRAGMNEYNRVYHMGIACRESIIRNQGA